MSGLTLAAKLVENSEKSVLILERGIAYNDDPNIRELKIRDDVSLLLILTSHRTAMGFGKDHRKRKLYIRLRNRESFMVTNSTSAEIATQTKQPGTGNTTHTWHR